MAKTINRTVITKVYDVRIINSETEEFRTIRVEFPDMTEKEVRREVRNSLEPHDIVTNMSLQEEKKVVYSMPAKDFYEKATAKSV